MTSERESGDKMPDKNDVAIAIAASLYANRITEDALRAEPAMEVIANEAWDLYYKLERAIRGTAPAAYERAYPGGT
jgi:hypothetical protein